MPLRVVEQIDELWDSTVAPMLLARFPGASREQVLEVRGYAYGGCVIQDLGGEEAL